MHHLMSGDQRRATADVLALSHLLIPLGWVGACHWFLADKKNPLIIFNSCWPFGEEPLDAFFPVARGLQRLCAKTALFHWFFFFFFLREIKPLTTHFSNSYIYHWNSAGQCVNMQCLSSLIYCWDFDPFASPSKANSIKLLLNQILIQ